MTSPGECDDHAAMQRLSEGDDLALNEIMDRWKRPLISYLFRLLGHEHEAIELAQETFVRVYQERLRYKPRGKFSVWVFTIATNLCRNQFRWKKRHPTVSFQTDEEADQQPSSQLIDHKERPDQALITKEKQMAVRKALETLPEDLKSAILLYEFEDLSYQEIATILGCSSKAVENRLYRARQILRDQLSSLQKS